MSGRSLAPFLDPASVAVIGASRDPSKVGGSVVANLRSAGFRGRILPINSRADSVQGLPAVRSLLDVEGPVDLAVIAVPAADVLPALKQCAAKQVGGAVVISAGFRETGGEGVRREAELREWLRDQPIRVLGPNCLGWIRPACRLNVTFAPGMPEPGGIAFITHSGALAVAILDWSRDRRVGFSLFASLGNQADLNESDLLDAVAADPETRVIACYLEGIADGRRFLGALRRAAAVKPVVLLKAGRSPEGARAVSSHTGALAGSDRAFDAAVRQAGALRVDTVEELFDIARGLASQPLPRGGRLIVVTNGGGLGIVATDAARAAGLSVAPLDEAVRQRLAEGLPATAGLGNPVDLVGDADARRYGHALHALGTDSTDAMLVLLTPQAATDAASIARTIAGATRGWPIPVAAAFVGGTRVAPGVRVLEEAGIPCYAFPETAVKALAGMARLAARRARLDVPSARTVDPARSRAWLAGLGPVAGRQLGTPELAPLLDAYGIPRLAARVAASAADAGGRGRGGRLPGRAQDRVAGHYPQDGGRRGGPGTPGRSGRARSRREHAPAGRHRATGGGDPWCPGRGHGGRREGAPAGRRARRAVRAPRDGRVRGDLRRGLLGYHGAPRSGILGRGHGDARRAQDGALASRHAG